MKVLLVEDDVELSKLLSGHLKAAGFAVDVVGSGEDGIFEASEFAYDCLILDVNLPDIDGFEVLKKLRRQKITTPVLMLTARSGIDDRVAGLNLGADDYVGKPVDSAELIARIKALIRRSGKETLPLLEVGDLVVDPQAHLVKRGKKTIDLNAKEFAVLEYLAYHSNEVVTRTMIMEHVWGSDFETLSNVVDVYIRYLRQKIDTKGNPPLIHTIRGKGYILSDQR